VACAFTWPEKLDVEALAAGNPRLADDLPLDREHLVVRPLRAGAGAGAARAVRSSGQGVVLRIEPARAG
jgi:hypothetical protein